MLVLVQFDHKEHKRYLFDMLFRFLRSLTEVSKKQFLSYRTTVIQAFFAAFFSSASLAALKTSSSFSALDKSPITLTLPDMKVDAGVTSPVKIRYFNMN